MTNPRTPSIDRRAASIEIAASVAATVDPAPDAEACGALGCRTQRPLFYAGGRVVCPRHLDTDDDTPEGDR